MVGAVLASVGLIAAKFLFVDELLRASSAPASIPPIEVSDVLWVSPILLMIGARRRRGRPRT